VLRWLGIDINNATWLDPQQVDNDGSLRLQTPGEGNWAVLIRFILKKI